jgi:hypothetical protein
MYFSELISCTATFSTGSHAPVVLLWPQPPYQYSSAHFQQILRALYAKRTTPDQVHVITCGPCFIPALYTG